MNLAGFPRGVDVLALLGTLVLLSFPADAQLTDITQTPNRANAGIQKSLEEQIGAGRGDVMTPDSSLFIIRRDPFRAIRRGRQVFQRKFTVAQGFGPRLNDGIGDIETVYDSERGIFNSLFATAIPLFRTVEDGTDFPPLKLPSGEPSLVENIFTDFKHHDLGPNFHERNFNGTMTTQFMALPLWGVGNMPPYGHDGHSINLREVILRHGGEAQVQREAFARLPAWKQDWVIRFLELLVIFPPDDTASTLDPGDPSAPGFPQRGHGSIRLSELFNDPSDLE
jgi:Di-haem oxidoreductase, putative peroxidase